MGMLLGTRVALAFAALWSCGCVTCPQLPLTPAPTPASSVEPVDEGPPMVFTPPADYDFSLNPQLLERLRADAYQYFRFVNVPFAQKVCEHYQPQLRSMPLVNLHGDAHVEQYAVTSTAQGLHDFDASTTGPAVLDLVRFGASLHLAMQSRGWSRGGDALDAFLKGYRAGLANPQVERPLPGLVARFRGGFSKDRRPFLKWAESLMDPVSAGTSFEKGYQAYVGLMHEQYPDLPKSFFKLKRAGRVRLGVGSALDIKLLARIEGPSDAPEDDVILEAKEVRDLRDITCVHAMVGDAFRILIAQARMADVPPRFMAQVPRVGGEPYRGAPFWVHEWSHDYQEIELKKNLASADELIEIAYDVGAQLGRGHAMHVAAPLDKQVRRAQLASLDDLEQDLRATVSDLVAQTLRGWERFKRESQ
jgi:hypothetical protein